MFGDAYTKGKTLGQLVDAIGRDAQPGSPVGERIKAAAYTLAMHELTEAIKDSVSTGTKLNKRLVWLNIVLTALAIVIPILVVMKT